MAMHKSRTKRVQFDFTEPAVRQLDELVAETGAASRAEVVRRALGLLKAALDTQKEGGKDQNGDVEKVCLY